MNQKIKSTTYDFELEDGSVVQLTLNFYFLYQLKNKHKDVYDRYNKIMQTTTNKNFDVLDMVIICYTAYLCANLNNETPLTEEEFFLLCGSDMNKVGQAVKALINPKKQSASVKLSSNEQSSSGSEK